MGRIALNVRRQEKPAASDDGGFASEDLAIASDDPEVELMRSLCKAEFNQAFTQALASLEVRERNLIRLRSLDALTLDELAAYFRVHRATVVRWLCEVTDRLFIETRRQLGEKLALDRPEVDSLLRAARSRVDFSLTSLLRRADPAS